MIPKSENVHASAWSAASNMGLKWHMTFAFNVTECVCMCRKSSHLHCERSPASPIPAQSLSPRSASRPNGKYYSLATCRALFHHLFRANHLFSCGAQSFQGHKLQANEDQLPPLRATQQQLDSKWIPNVFTILARMQERIGGAYACMHDIGGAHPWHACIHKLPSTCMYLHGCPHGICHLTRPAAGQGEMHVEVTKQHVR